MRKGVRKVLWGLLYVVLFIVVFALSAVMKLTQDPLGGKYSVKWNDSVGTVHTDLVYGKQV